jgi:cytochrome P450
MSWFVYMMTLHPHVEQKLFEELRSLGTENVVNGDVDSNEDAQTADDRFNERVKSFSELLTFDALLKLQYLHACILETLRLYPVVPLVIPLPCNSNSLMSLLWCEMPGPYKLLQLECLHPCIIFSVERVYML